MAFTGHFTPEHGWDWSMLCFPYVKVKICYLCWKAEYKFTFMVKFFEELLTPFETLTPLTSVGVLLLTTVVSLFSLHITWFSRKSGLTLASARAPCRTKQTPDLCTAGTKTPYAVFHQKSYRYYSVTWRESFDTHEVIKHRLKTNKKRWNHVIH